MLFQSPNIYFLWRVRWTVDGYHRYVKDRDLAKESYSLSTDLGPLKDKCLWEFLESFERSEQLIKQSRDVCRLPLGNFIVRAYVEFCDGMFYKLIQSLRQTTYTNMFVCVMTGTWAGRKGAASCRREAGKRETRSGNVRTKTGATKERGLAFCCSRF